METCCAAGKPVQHEYEPEGRVKDMGGGLSAYVTGGDQAGAVILLPDIFGYTHHPQLKQTADRLSAAGGFTVAIPDTWRGRGYDMSAMSHPPTAEERAQLMAWMEREGSFEKVSKDVYQIVAALKARGAAKFAVAGACWGAAPAMQLAGADPQTFRAVGMVHPSLFGRERELTDTLMVPVALVAAKGDPLEAVQEALAARPDLAARSRFVRFDDVTHGFTAARGDFRDPTVCRRVAEAAALLGAFFAANMG